MNSIKLRMNLAAWLVRRKYVAKKEKLVEGRLLFHWRRIGYRRTDLIRALLASYPSSGYLEIGCRKDRSFNAVTAAKKTGVDPASGGTHRMTSDAFFETNQERFDFVFIDGLHTYEQVRRDVINSLRFLQPGGIIAIHDMLPSSWEWEHVPRLHRSWNGSVWKVAYEIRERFGAKFGIVVADHGIGVIFNDLSPYPPFSSVELERIKKLRFADFERDHKAFNLVPVEKVADFIKNRFYSAA
ncbi:MAG TPA: class I SAM-dependent methyltransferase [Candidatus Angelobacter sp.]|nr:class I SAM-dependent methyltransferase [Candidatus Angelobacter sp.]